MHKPQPDSEQWQRAAFLMDYAVAAINRTGQDQVENDAYWTVWHEDKQHLMIGRKSDQAVIVEAHFNHKTEQWGIDYSNVGLEDWQDFKDRQQARQQEEQQYYHGLYNHFAPQQVVSVEQRDRVVAGKVWGWAQTQGLEERAAAKEAALTLVYQAHVQQMGQQQGDDVALAYVNRIVREATASHQLSVETTKQIEL
ncbi:MAG TPA: hypothetical protein V6C65_27625 [Allocoleopsis sp.]